MDYSDKDILDKDVGGITIRDMSSLDFMGWLSARVNGLPSYSAATVELTMAISNPPMGRTMPELEKVRLFRKLLELNVEL